MIRALNIYITIALGANTKYCVRSLASDPQPTILDVRDIANAGQFRHQGSLTRYSAAWSARTIASMTMRKL
jgi:hypothetical protein